MGLGRSSAPHRPPLHPPSDYVELGARSNFSFLQAASFPQELVQRAAELQYDAIGIADRDGLYGIVRAHEEAETQGVRLVVGCELTTRAAPPHASITVHVATLGGYKHLCEILTESHRLHPKGVARKRTDGVPRNCSAGVPVTFVCDRSEGLWCMIHEDVSDADARSLREAFGERFSIAVRRHLDGGDGPRGARAQGLARELNAPIVATNAVRYARRDTKPLYDVVHCIRECTTLEAAGRDLAPNAEAHLKSPAEMRAIFADHPDWLARTRDIADACHFRMSELAYRFPFELEKPAHPNETPDEALRRLTYDGARGRYRAAIPEKVREQVERELRLIADLEVAPYFLSTQSIVAMARRRDILCQGRGSAANSAVCYCLGITAVDPARSNLLFERFLSAERKEPPDIDIDFEHERREEVIQEIYSTYGRDRAAMVSEVISYRGKSALREVGKVFGLSLEQIGRLASVVSYWDSASAVRAERLKNAGFDRDDERIQMVLTMAQAIQGFPRHLSIHVGGFVLSAEPLVHVAPVEPATMKDRTIIPWDKDDIDSLGFFKVDVLGLGMLTAIRKALDLVQHDARVHAATAIDRLARIPPEDPEVYDALCKADTVGVFQIESRAQMAMLPRLKPRKFYDLVVEVALVRPGPIQGGMIHPYLRRRAGKEPCDSPHPILAPILDRTLGVPIFQEQVMQIAIVGAGYTGGEADALRRDMAAWKRRGTLERHRARLTQGFAERGISEAFADQLYAQIQGFAEYGFPESHAASFALLVYASSWIKRHHLAEFATALINSQPMGFYSASTILEDAKRHCIEVRRICVHASDWDCTVEDGAIRVGLRQVRGLGKEGGKRIEQARKTGGSFVSIEELAARAALQKKELDVLAAAGALDVLVQGGRREALWKVRAPRGAGLFTGLDLGDALPALPHLTRAEQLVLDYGSTGVSVADHPMRLARPSLAAGVKRSSELMAMPHRARVTTAGLVICRQRPQTASGVVFITLEDEEGFINLILYARVFELLHHVATTSTMLTAHGNIERDGACVYLIVAALKRLALSRPGNRAVPPMSRDFH
ncbi:error-prone DNA polymerase [Pendulispora brunnea]|uniref:DNA-directed DNA polymerase n=1 Tax=Pendulispora brunnea TaxID=2905690 RepID=A0ABZ2KMT8_9BACT